MGEHVVSGGEVRAGQLVTLRADGTVSAAAPVDALGQPVPEWAREAYAVLSADGRRVFVGGWQDRDAFYRAGDATLNGSGVAIVRDDKQTVSALVRQQCAGFVFGDHATLADAARRALAIEAERKASARKHTQSLIGFYETQADFERGIGDALAGAERRYPSNADLAKYAPPTDPGPRPRCVAVPVPEPTGMVTCLRCGGPAGYLGIACQRVGGCRTAEERVAGMPRPGVVVYYSRRMREVVFVCGDSGEQQSSAAAIAAWRDAMLARERGR